MVIRDEHAGDAAAIREVVRAAFAGAEHSSGTEPAIVDGLREAGALTVSLVALDESGIAGHVAISPVSVGAAKDWYGLGPVAVRPDCQRKGIGSALIREALGALRTRGAAGCVVLGDPAYYAGSASHRTPRSPTPTRPRLFSRCSLSGRHARTDGCTTTRPSQRRLENSRDRWLRKRRFRCARIRFDERGRERCG